MAKNKKIIFIVGAIVLLLSISMICLFAFKNKEKAIYVVTFDSNNGSAISEQNVEEGKNAIKPQDPVREGYIFIEWLLNGKSYNFNNVVDKNITLSAKWEEIVPGKEIAIIKFNSDGGTTIANVVVEKGSKVEKPTDPTKDGYTFIEWQLDGAKYDFELEVTDNLELVAKWEENKAPENKPANNDKNNNVENNNPENNNAGNNNPITITTPTLRNDTLDTWNAQFDKKYIPILMDGKYGYDLAIDKNVYRNENGETSVTGYVIYEKTANGYKEIGNHKINGAEVVFVEVEPGQKKEYVARVYVTDSKGKKEYSEYSNVVTIDHTIVETPKLRNDTLEAWNFWGSGEKYIPILQDGKYLYDIAIDKTAYREVYESGYYVGASVTGYVIYEKTSNGYKEIESHEINGVEVVLVEIEPGQKKEYVARVYATDSKGQKYYSAYSNVVTIDHTVVETPKLRNDTLDTWNFWGSGEKYIPILQDGKYLYDIGIDKTAYREIYESGYYAGASVTGYVIYEKTSNGYREIENHEINGAEIVLVEIEPGQKKEYVARVYATDSKGQKHYSAYSNVVTIDHTNVETPRLINVTVEQWEAQFSEKFIPILQDGKYLYDIGIDKTAYREIYESGYYAGASVTGYVIYEKTANGYREIESHEINGVEVILVEIEPGQKKEYVARVYATDSKGQKHYSAYSNVITIDHTN